MKSLSLLSASGLILGCAIAASAQVRDTIAFDENGAGTFQQNTAQPTPLVFTAVPLTYLLPFPVTPGDVLINDTPGAALTLGDLLRFTANASVEVFSDSSPTDPADALADLSPFPSAGSFSANAVTIPEIGPEGNNGISYTPLPGQPGSVPTGLPLTYNFASDSPVPETSSSVSLGLLLALGLGGYAIARKRKAA